MWLEIGIGILGSLLLLTGDHASRTTWILLGLLMTPPWGGCLVTEDCRCTAIARGGGRCKNAVVRGAHCRFHSAHPEDRARVKAMGKRGGISKAYGALPSAPSIADVVDVDVLDLETPAGARALLAGALRQLARLPLDVRVANALAQVCTAQRAIIESSDLVRRLDALEAATVRRAG